MNSVFCCELCQVFLVFYHSHAGVSIPDKLAAEDMETFGLILIKGGWAMVRDRLLTASILLERKRDPSDSCLPILRNESSNSNMREQGSMRIGVETSWRKILQHESQADKYASKKKYLEVGHDMRM